MRSQKEFTSISWTNEGSIFYHVAPTTYATLIDKFVQSLLRNSEQEDKRHSSLSKEEGKDEEIKKLENIIDSASTAIDNQTKEIERLTAENEGNKTIAIERGKAIEELQGEIERLKRLIERSDAVIFEIFLALYKGVKLEALLSAQQQFQKENGLTNK